jgi:sulfatase maturation enzyme AslB (radical SAM superfamily)
MLKSEAFQMGMGYAWGWQDGCDDPLARDSIDAMNFGMLYADAWDAFHREDCRRFSLRPVCDLYALWVGGWRTMGKVQANA